MTDLFDLTVNVRGHAVDYERSPGEDVREIILNVLAAWGQRAPDIAHDAEGFAAQLAEHGGYQYANAAGDVTVTVTRAQ